MNPFSELRKCLGFLTVLPVGMGFKGYEEVARAAWLFPVAGGIVALVASAAAFASLFFLPRDIAAGIALLVLLLLTGFHHLDGLLDFADAAMVRGDRGARLKAMHDLNHGVAAFGAGFFVLLLTYLAVYEAEGILPSLVVGEASAKFAMVLAAYSARQSSHQGMGSAFVNVLRGNHRLMLLTLIVYTPFLLLAWESAPIVLLSVAVTALLIVNTSYRLFGGVSGDVFGAVNELSRLVAMLVLV
ncbi:adenosylcobinamide-GDP ribazoletransferase [Candidatus Pyrohabitans sp.]